MLHSIYPFIYENTLWLVSDVASYDVSTGELFVNHNSQIKFSTKQHNSLMHQFRKLEDTYCLTPLDIVTPSCFGYILYRYENDTFFVCNSKRYNPTEDRNDVIVGFLQQHSLAKRYSRRKMRLCKKVFGAVTEKNLSVLVTSKSEKLH
jgi:hypothetical protein